jgi:glycosyltransferase involved in cell wall biosynthesis
MKILHCIPTVGYGGYGGAERQISYLAPALVKRGHEVHVASAQRGVFEARLIDGGVTLHDVGGRGNHDLRIFWKLLRLMAALRPDVVQTNLPQMDVFGGLAALLTRTPWIVRESSAAPSYRRGSKSGLRRLLGRAASAIVSNSREGDAYWRAARTRRVIANGVPLEEIGAAAAEGNVVLFAGRMDEGKNAATLVDALNLLDVDFTAALCGDGPQRRALERKAGPRIEFAGWVGDLWERMRRAAVVVSLSRFEGCSNVVLEAMACGTPLVVSDIAAHRELLGDDGALFVDADDPAAAAAAIAATLRDRGFAQARARAARARAVRCSVDETARLYEEVYRAIAASPRAG